MKDFIHQNYYELLEIAPDASQDDILRAYQRARNTYSSQSPALYSIFNKQEAQELLRLIDEAYTVLSNQFKRRKYDESQGVRASPPGREPTPSPAKNEMLAIPDADDMSFVSTEALPQKSFRPPELQAEEPPVSAAARAATQSPAFQNAVQTSPAIVRDKISSMGQTRFGSYKIDEKMEEELARIVEVDGPTLQRIRTYKNISFDQICDSVRVGRHYLAAIEADDFASLPAPVFVRGFVSQISKILGLDPEKSARSYTSRLKSFKK